MSVRKKQSSDVELSTVSSPPQYHNVPDDFTDEGNFDLSTAGLTGDNNNPVGA